MKKLALRILIGLLVLLILAFVVVGLFLDRAVKGAVETVGPKLAKVEIKLDSVRLSLFSGAGKVKGLLIGNPEGFKTPNAINVGAASLALAPGSLLSDKIVVKSINVEAPEITFETDFKGNNLNRIVSNLQDATGGNEPAPAKPKETAPKEKAAKPSKKLEVDDFLITGGKIHVSATILGGQALTVPLPTIHLTDLGKDNDGITAGELMKRVLSEIEKATADAVKNSAGDVGKTATDLSKGAEKSATDKISKGIGDLFKKKN
jgi:uncharacterized protein involved in outer membrane biogenesis